MISKFIDSIKNALSKKSKSQLLNTTPSVSLDRMNCVLNGTVSTYSIGADKASAAHAADAEQAANAEQASPVTDETVLTNDVADHGAGNQNDICADTASVTEDTAPIDEPVQQPEQMIAENNASTLQSVIFLAEFANREAANDVVKLSLGANDCSRAELIEPDGGEIYTVAVELNIVPKPSRIHEIQETMQLLAQSYGGTAKDWQFSKPQETASTMAA